MANLKFFATVAGEVVSLANIDNRGREGRFGFHPETNAWVKIERVVERKSNPSRHECDDRCLNATGKIMRCECACGGKNHGRGSFVSVGAF